MKILYFNPVGTIGGAEMCLLDVLATVRSVRSDWQLAVVLGDDGPLKRAVEDLGISCYVLPLPGNLARMGDAGGKEAKANGGRRRSLLAKYSAAMLGTATYVARLRRLIRAEAPDLIQTNGMKAHVLAAWAAPRRLPILWHVHEYIASRPVMTRLLRISSYRRIYAVAVSRSIADDATHILGSRVSTRTIYNAVDLERFAPDAEGTDHSWLDEAAGLPPAPEGTVRVGLVATFAVWKGHALFLNAISRFSANSQTRFYIVGGPIYRSVGSQVTLEQLQEQAESLGMKGLIGFTGHQADASKAIRSLDIVVHASTRPEPFGRVIVEGMACGRAVVATQAGGAAELFVDGITALGCPPCDSEQLANAIGRLIDDPELRRRMGLAGRQAARNQFDRRRVAEQWTNLYDSIGPRQRPAGGNAPGQEKLTRGNERSEA